METRILFYVLAFLMLPGCTSLAQTGEISYFEVTGNVQNGSRAVPFTALIPGGRGPFPLVVINHGHGGSREENGGFRRLAEAITKRGIATIRMDFPGCGESKAPFTQNTMTNMISDSNACLAYMLEKYPIDKTRLGIFGYSLGGRIAMDIVNQPNQPYKALGLLAPTVTPGNDIINFFTGGEAKARALEATAKANGFVTVTSYGQPMQLSKEWFADLRNSQPLNKVVYAGPSLIVLGNKDRVFTTAECDAVEKALKSAEGNVSRVLVPDANHGYGFFSDQIEVTFLVESSIADFFEKNL
ncbi:MAG: alpha/beta hydrolase [Treponema sp.]|nr:alpha/beta hydrolase [Treponema sp.]